MTGPLLKILMLGDIIGKTGRDLFKRHKNRIITDYKLDAIIVNGENSADSGKGITPAIADFFKDEGVVVITMGNHMWDDESIIPYIKTHTHIIRPANMSSQCPGAGITFFSCKGYTIGVMNLVGRVFMSPFASCPLATAERLEFKAVTPIMLVDFHAAATAEKLGLGFYLDGRVSAVVGTHTHTQTNDARILPGGTAYMSDLGMSGSLYSVVGYKAPGIIEKFTTGMRTHSERGVATDAPYMMNGAIITIDAATGKAVAIERLFVIDHEPLEREL